MRNLKTTPSQAPTNGEKVSYNDLTLAAESRSNLDELFARCEGCYFNSNDGCSETALVCFTEKENFIYKPINS